MRTISPFALGSLAATLFLCGATASAQSQFQTRQYKGPWYSKGICSGDFNGDGRTDVATADGNFANVSILFGQADGTLSAATFYSIASGFADLTSIVPGDFNADGNLDWAVTDAANDTVEIWLNNGAGSFAHSSTTNVGGSPIRVLSGRLDQQDSKLDVAVLCSGSSNVWILRGNGTGGVLSTSNTTPFGGSVNLTDMAIARLNADSVLDCAVVDAQNDRVWIATNNGLGTFVQSQVLNLGAASQPWAIALGDTNSDTKNDIVLISRGSQTMDMYAGNGNGTVATTPFNTVNDGTFSGVARLQLGDFNADSKIDCGVTYESDVELHFYCQDALGMFVGNDIWLPTSPFNYGFAFGDFDGDGLKDVVIPNFGEAGVTLVRGTATGKYSYHGSDFYASPITDSCVVSDFNLDGVADVVSCDLFGRVLMSYGFSNNFGYQFIGDAPNAPGDPWHIEAGDFNSDGFPDVVIACAAANGVALELSDPNNGGQLLSPTYTTVSSDPRGLDIADVNLDGIADVVAACNGANNCTILLGDGAGGFVNSGTLAVSVNPMFVVAADLNEDGAPDFVTAGQSNGEITVALGLGDGTFPLTTNDSSGAGTSSVAVGDFNGDLRLDVVAVNAWDNTLASWTGDGTGALNSYNSYNIGVEPTDVKLADVDGDGKLDVSVIHHGADWRNLGILPGDGAGNFGTMTTYAVFNRQSWYKMELEIADLDGDGQSDILVSAGFFGPVFINNRTQPSGLTIYNGGTSGCQGVLGVSATGEPHIGTPAGYGFTVTNAPPRALGIGLASDSPDFVGTDLFGLAFTVNVDVFFANEIFIFDVVSDMNGGAFAPVSIPLDGNLIGNNYYFQSIWYMNSAAPCKPSPYYFDSSRLLQIQILP